MKKGPETSAGPGGDGDALQRLFESARSDGLARGQIDELWSRIGPAAALGSGDPGAGAGTGASSAAGTGGLGLKAVAVLLVGGGLVAGGLAHPWRAAQPPARPIVVSSAPVHAVSPSVAPSPLAPPLTPPDVASPQAVDVSALPPAVARTGPKGRAAAPTAVEGHAFNRALSRQFPAQNPSPSAGSPAAAVPSPSPAAAPAVPAAAAPATFAAGSQGGAQPTRATATLSPAPTEGAILLRARQELASDPAGALALTDEHARRFPGGTLAQEREVLAIEALAALGRAQDARARLAAFRAAFPQSRHLARLDALVSK